MVRNRKELNCPICGRKFVQASWNQVYCGQGCADTAKKIKDIRRLTIKRIDEVLKHGKQ